MLLQGLKCMQQSTDEADTYVFGFNAARTTANTLLHDLWNGSADTARKTCIDLDGKIYSAALTAGDVLYAVTGGVSYVRRLDSLAIGTAGQVFHVNAGADAPEWTSTLAGLTSVTSTAFVGDLTGNADTATALATVRAINGVGFDGTAAITVTAAAGTLTGTTLNSSVVTSSLTSVGTIASLTVSGDLTFTSGGGVVLTDGTLSVPAVRFANDINTGLMWVTPDTLQLVSNGTALFKVGHSLTSPIYGYISSITGEMSDGIAHLGGVCTGTGSNQDMVHMKVNGQFQASGQTGMDTTSLDVVSYFTAGTYATYIGINLGAAASAGTPTITNWKGLSIDPTVASATLATATGISIESNAAGTTFYGLKIEHQSAAGTNYAIHTGSGACRFGDDVEIDGDLNHDGSNIGFYGIAPVAQQTGVAVSAAGIHAALVNLGLITA